MELLIEENLDSTEAGFDKIYKAKYQKASKLHWTPAEVIETAIGWLNCNEKSRILDIGSGVGKFCIVGSFFSKAIFTEVEKRKDLVSEANRVKNELDRVNVSFLHSNITAIDFSDFDIFYYYNPFYEQKAVFGCMDQKNSFSEEKFEIYSTYVLEQLNKKAIGTKVVLYHSTDLSLHEKYELNTIFYDGALQLWIKTKK
jgi:16S rRNA A1518/A1519 N6-dimethyltransferase RsmA/KsgA/DIM1 with predicted DNA glycosylase/AP lyase activity